jgi:hypothetical protein
MAVAEVNIFDWVIRAGYPANVDLILSFLIFSTNKFNKNVCTQIIFVTSKCVALRLERIAVFKAFSSIYLIFYKKHSC